MMAFDYFIPGAFLPEDADPKPTVEGIGIPMTWSDANQGWVVHIWAWKHNKDGMFDNYNPDVATCPCEISPESASVPLG